MIITRRALMVVVFVLSMFAFGFLAVRAEIVTQPFTEMGNGQVIINFDHNLGNGNVLRFRCINNSAYDAWLGVYDCPDGQCSLVGEQICGAGETLEINVPGISVAWICELYDPEHPEWGEDCGLRMGDYQFRARWPN